MKKNRRIMVALMMGVAVGLAMFGAAGCNRERNTTAPANPLVGEKTETVAGQSSAAEHPASDKPKDHPAH